MNNTRKITAYADGTLKVEVQDTRTVQEKLEGKLTFGEKLALMYPTSENDVTAGWVEFDNHKRL